jgi:hypothetical protein
MRTFVFAATVALSAALLFTLQPMFARFTLPYLGGAPGVWNTAMVFYQAALLAGYAYAFGVSKIRNGPVQIGLHLTLLAFAALFLPPAISSLAGNPPEGTPIGWLLGMFALSIGPLCVMLSATAPLTQSWFAHRGDRDPVNPYWLYAASNLGSFGALAAYPLLIEPFIGARLQSDFWAIGFAIFVALIIGCSAYFVGATRRAPLSGLNQPDSNVSNGKISWTQRLKWIALSAVPSGLLLAVTSYVSADIASAPFLWVIPLGLYLLTFVFVFADRELIPMAVVRFVAPIAALALLASLAVSVPSWWVALLLHGGAFFIIAMALHGELAATRPDASRLTEFYLWMSFGGVLGGAFTALASPAIFNNILEYPILLVGALALLRPTQGRMTLYLWCVSAVAGVLAIGVALLGHNEIANINQPRTQALALCLFAGVALAYLGARSRPLVLGALAALIALAGQVAFRTGNYIHEERSFFGVMRVADIEGRQRRLLHGTTIHGVQALDASESRTPMSYYGPKTPIGQALKAMQDSIQGAHVGIVGLGAGASACWARPSETWTFFEIDPSIKDIATNPEMFSFYSQCTPNAPIVIGDARLTLSQIPDGSLDILLLDAFSSDVVPAHLMTVEALRMYMTKMSPRGVIIYHVSNRAMALEGVVGDVIAAAGYPALAQSFSPMDPIDSGGYNYGTDAVVVARDRDALGPFRMRACSEIADELCWRAVAPLKERPWTDDYSNVVGAILAKQRGAN